ncbi:type II toxin-antitoxin system VapC family toxin [Candidatus Magnetomonas plexicatena]|uniref:type II toxin-antitoxin system VapC family toxin n=1 Tax=Candidatus Magnetomonas plexicatena TaxID=2552947 RepID=UPI0011004999|nr:PIN domain-containing protein [Nitrospirales bacterium LBB_01]
MEFRVLLDTDVVINWLIEETETVSGRELWKAPFEIVRLIEDRNILGFISLTTLLEIRYLLRRKKSYNDQQIEKDISKITGIFDVVIPDEITLLRANSLQSVHPLDPFDAIHLSVAIGLKPITLISRDKEFINLAENLVDALTPENFIKTVTH